MSKIKVDIESARNETNTALPNVRNQINTIASGIQSQRYGIYNAVLSRNGINDQFNSINRSLSNINSRIQQFYSELNRYLDKYSYTEDRIVQSATGTREMTGPSSNAAQFDPTGKTHSTAEINTLDIIKSILSCYSVGGVIPQTLIGATLEFYKTIFGGNLSKQEIGEAIKTVLSEFGSVSEGISKIGKIEEFGLASPILGYLGTLSETLTKKYDNGLDATSGILSLIGKSAGVETGLFKYYEKTLHPYQAKLLDDKFGNGMGFLSIIGSGTKTVQELIKEYQVLNDPDSKWYDKTSQFFKTIGSGFDTAGKTYTTIRGTDKVLTFVGKKGNQILATEMPTLKYTTSTAATANIDKANTVLALLNVAFSSISGGVKRYGQVTEDGQFDWGDAGSVGVSFSCHGLNAVTQGLTFGLVEFDADAMSTNLENRADAFLERDSKLAQYIKNTDNNVVLRFGASIGAAAEILGEEVWSGVKYAGGKVVDGTKAAADWVAKTWDSVFLRKGGGFR